MVRNTSPASRHTQFLGSATIGLTLVAVALVSACAAPPSKSSYDSLSLKEGDRSSGLSTAWEYAQESDQEEGSIPTEGGDTAADSSSGDGGGENASNPLAAVSNTDLRFQYFDLDGSNRSEYWVDGAYMFTPKLKLKYEFNYWDTDVTGSDEAGVETIHLKPIYFPKQGAWGSWKYKVAVGLEWIVDFGNEDKGIGTGSDGLGPFVGLAMTKGNTVLIPLVQHFVSYDGPDVSTTALRLIAIQSLPDAMWGKLDAILPIDWENDNAIPATGEVQLGKMISPSFGVYMDALVGVGGDKPYEWGVGVGVRFNY